MVGRVRSGRNYLRGKNEFIDKNYVAVLVDSNSDRWIFYSHNYFNFALTNKKLYDIIKKKERGL